jgi:hypothetical protein
MYKCGHLFIYCFWRLTHVVLKVEKLHTEYLLAKRMSLLLLSCSFPMLFVSICVVIFLVVVFLFTTSSIPTCCLGFHFNSFSVNTYLQQSTCIMFISCVVEFALSCCLLLFACSLRDHFPRCLGFRFFCFFKENCNNPLEVIWQNAPFETWWTTLETCSSYMFQNLCRL